MHIPLLLHLLLRVICNRLHQIKDSMVNFFDLCFKPAFPIYTTALAFALMIFCAFSSYWTTDVASIFVVPWLTLDTWIGSTSTAIAILLTWLA